MSKALLKLNSLFCERSEPSEARLPKAIRVPFRHGFVSCYIVDLIVLSV